MIHHLDQSSPVRRGSRRLESAATKRDPSEYIGHSTDAARWTDDPGDRGRVAIRYPHPAGIPICDFAIHPSPAPRSVGQQIAFLPMDEGPHYIMVDEQCPCFPGNFPFPSHSSRCIIDPFEPHCPALAIPAPRIEPRRCRTRFPSNHPSFLSIEHSRPETYGHRDGR